MNLNWRKLQILLVLEKNNNNKKEEKKKSCRIYYRNENLMCTYICFLDTDIYCLRVSARVTQELLLV